MGMVRGIEAKLFEYFLFDFGEVEYDGLGDRNDKFMGGKSSIDIGHRNNINE